METRHGLLSRRKGGQCQHAQMPTLSTRWSKLPIGWAVTLDNKYRLPPSWFFFSASWRGGVKVPFFSATLMGVTAREMHRNDLLHALPKCAYGTFSKCPLCERYLVFHRSRKSEVKEKVGKKEKNDHLCAWSYWSVLKLPHQLKQVLQSTCSDLQSHRLWLIYPSLGPPDKW